MIIFILLLETALALGIRPAQTTMESETTKDYSGTFWVVNNEGREFMATVSLEGEMAQYVTIKTETLSFRGDDDAKPIEFEVHLPEEVPPGSSTANIIVKESFAAEGSNVVSSSLVLKHKIIVVGPYPDKYITAKLNFYERKNDIRMVAEVTNRGRKDISQIQANFYVNDQKQKEHVLKSEQTSLSKEENKLLETQIDKDLFERGEFEVATVIEYDDQKLETTKVLRIGKPEIDITYFNEFFIANKINEYTIDLLNLWNQKIRHVFVDVNIKKNQQPVDEFRTKSVDIEGLSAEKINDYLNTKGKEPGKYLFELTVNFWDDSKMDSKTYNVEFLPEDEEIPKNIAGAATGFFGTVPGVIAIILMSLVGSITIIYLLLRKRLNSQQFQKPPEL